MRNLVRWTVPVVLLMALAACQSKPAARPLPDLKPAGGTVYDDGGKAGDSDASDAGSDLQEEQVTSDELGELDGTGVGAGDTLEDFSNRGNVDLDWPPIFFEFDQDVLSETAKRELADHAEEFKRNPSLVVLLEGHCDTRGTEDYNLALGERRAQSVRRYLVQLGVAENRMRTMSYGEMRPLETGENEAAWSRNRRVSFTF